MSRISTEDELKKDLGIHSVDELADQKNQRKLINLLAANKISIELARELMTTISELPKAFSAIIATMGDMGKSLDETDRHRWSILKELATSGSLTPDQIIEAMRILQEIREKEQIDIGKIIAKALTALAGIAALILFALNKGGNETPET